MTDSADDDCKMTPSFALSQQLSDHQHGVRDVAIIDDCCIATCEERGMMHIFERSNTNTPFTKKDVLGERVHLSLTFVIEAIKDRQGRGANGYPAMTFMSGGADKAARPFTANGSFLDALEAHGNSVNSISVTDDGHVLTGAWDGIIRVWNASNRVYEITGHEYGVEVLAVDDRIISGSGNKAIHIHSFSQGKAPTLIRKIPNAHDHAIRKLIRHPLGFASCGNDGFIKVWSLDGEIIQTIPAHANSEVKFVYGLTFIQSTEEIVSCGEDGEVKVWDMSGKLVTNLSHPSPVRAVKALSNGDLLTACTDKTARVWTRAEARYAPAQERADYTETISVMQASGMKSLDTDSMPNESALEKPGTKDGQVLVVNVSGKGATAYQWSSEAETWVEIGQALGRSNKQMIDGVAYDFSTDVFVDETHKVKLGFNRDDDPLEVADRFCALHGLPADAKAQIVEHVRPLTDPVAVAQRKQLEAEQSEQESVKQVPSWRQCAMEIYATAKSQPMRERLLASNTKLQSLNPSEVAILESIMTMISDPRFLQNAPWTKQHTSVVVKMLSWPHAEILPVMDMVRMCFIHAEANNALFQHPDTWRLLGSHVTQGQEVHLTLYLKIVSNWVAKRPRSPAERTKPARIPDAVRANVIDSLRLSSSFSEADSQSTAYAMYLHNLCSWLGRMEAFEGCEPIYSAITRGVVRALDRKNSHKVAFYCLLSLGTIAFAVREARPVIMNEGAELPRLVNACLSHENQAAREAASDVKRLLSLP